MHSCKLGAGMETKCAGGKVVAVPADAECCVCLGLLSEAPEAEEIPGEPPHMRAIRVATQSQPYVTLCGHVMHSACLADAYHHTAAGANGRCPVCRTEEAYDLQLGEPTWTDLAPVHVLFRKGFSSLMHTALRGELRIVMMASAQKQLDKSYGGGTPNAVKVMKQCVTEVIDAIEDDQIVVFGSHAARGAVGFSAAVDDITGAAVEHGMCDVDTCSHVTRRQRAAIQQRHDAYDRVFESRCKAIAKRVVTLTHNVYMFDAARCGMESVSPSVYIEYAEEEAVKEALRKRAADDVARAAKRQRG